MTQVAHEFFLSEDIANFTIENDDSSSGVKPLWVSVERHGAFHLALALGVGQTARGPLIQFYRDMSMSCELVSQIDEKNVQGFSFQAFFESEDGSARIILTEAPLSRDNKESNFTLDLSVLRDRCGHLGLRCFSPSGHFDLESKLAVLKWVAGPNEPHQPANCSPSSIAPYQGHTQAVQRSLRPSYVCQSQDGSGTTGCLRPSTSIEHVSRPQAQVRRPDYGGGSTGSSVSQGCGWRGRISVRPQSVGESHSDPNAKFPETHSFDS